MKTETTKKRIRNTFEFSLTPRQQKALDRKAKSDRISKIAVIRDAITFYCC